MSLLSCVRESAQAQSVMLLPYYMKTILLKCLLAAGVMFVSSGINFGCSCLFPRTAAESFGRAQAVFTGKITVSSGSEWVVAVDRVWKGNINAQVELFDAHPRTSCATKYEIGKRYLFLVNEEVANGVIRYSPQVCNWGIRLKSAKIWSVQGSRVWVENWVLSGRGKGRRPSERSQMRAKHNTRLSGL